MFTITTAFSVCFVLPRPLAALVAFILLCASGWPRVVFFGGAGVLAVPFPSVFLDLCALLVWLSYVWPSCYTVPPAPPASPTCSFPLRLRGGLYSGSDVDALAVLGNYDSSSQSNDSNDDEEFEEVDIGHYLRVPREEDEDDDSDDEDDDGQYSQDDSGMEADDEDDDDDDDEDDDDSDAGVAPPSVLAHVDAPATGDVPVSSAPLVSGLDGLPQALWDALAPIYDSALVGDSTAPTGAVPAPVSPAQPLAASPPPSPVGGLPSDPGAVPVASGGVPAVSGSGDQSAAVPVPPLPGDGAVFPAAVLEQSVPAALAGLVVPAVEADVPAVPHTVEDVALGGHDGDVAAVGGAAGDFDDGAGTGDAAGAFADIPSAGEEEWEPTPMDIDDDEEEGNHDHEVWDPMVIHEDATMTLRRGGCRRRNAVLNHGRRRRIMALPLGVPAYRFAGPYTIPWYMRSLSSGQRRRNIQTGALMML